MTKTMISLSALAVGFLLGLTGDVAAHSMWLVETADTLEVQYGHENALDPYKPDRVIDIRAVSPDGTTLATSVQKNETTVTIRAMGAALVSTVYDNKNWTKSASKGWVNLPRSEVPDGSQSGQSVKFTKIYLASFPNFGKPLGHVLEIMPQSDPATLKAGDKLSVQIRLNGKPLAGAKVATNMFDYSSGAKPATTDAKGMVTVTVPSRKLAGIEIEHFAKTEPAGPTDGTWYTASITFRVASTR